MPEISIVNAAKALLSNLEEQMVALGVTLPARTGTVPGNFVAWDDEQFVVSWGSLTRGQPEATDAPQARAQPPFLTILYYEFHLTLLRKVSHLSGTGKGGIPSITKLGADFDKLAGDAEALLVALMTIHSKGLVVAPRIPFWYGPIEPIGPEGALGGVICPVAFQAGVGVDGTY